MNILKECTRFQFYIELLDIKPKIWRRFQVESVISFNRLHRAIQAVMGWQNVHSHSFFLPGDLIITTPVEPSMMQSGRTFLSSKNQSLWRHLKLEGIHFSYTYDDGDNWEHRIKLEKILPYDPQAVLPLCLGGENACPPEDAGGPPGFDYLMKMRNNPEDPNYEDYIVNWLGTDYDPTVFNTEAVNRKLVKMRSRHF